MPDVAMRATAAVQLIRDQIAGHLTFADMAGASQFTEDQVNEVTQDWAAIIAGEFGNCSCP